MSLNVDEERTDSTDLIQITGEFDSISQRTCKFLGEYLMRHVQYCLGILTILHIIYEVWALLTMQSSIQSG